MRFDIDRIIYAYILICSASLIYSIFFVNYTNWQKKKYNEYTDIWKKSVKTQLERLKLGDSIEQKHKEKLESTLTNINQLISYSHILDALRDEGLNVNDYLMENYKAMKSLAYKYKKKEVSDRAFFAFFISNNPPCNGEEYNSLMEILISYLENSNIYCRENVLKALYALGNSQAVENAFQIINAESWFHNNKLLSDGLMTYTGDKEELSENLFNYFNLWDENIVISIIKFITHTSDKFNERLFSKLKSRELGIDLQISIIRYYKSYHYEPMRLLLINNLYDTTILDENIMIVSASVLEKYPGEDTINVLKHALRNPNWYVRYNAASSLKRLNVTINRLKDIMEGDDNYAKEMVTYIMNTNKDVDNYE